MGTQRHSRGMALPWIEVLESRDNKSQIPDPRLDLTPRAIRV